MNHFIALYFFVIAVLLSGLFYIARTSGDTTSHQQSRRYWSVALTLDVAGVLLFCAFFMILDPLAEPRSIGTLANTALFGAFVYQALSFRALRQKVSLTGSRVACAVVIVFGVLWQSSRGLATAEVKGLLFGLSTSALLVWQIVETYRNQQQLALSLPLRLVMATLVAELGWTLVRAWAFAGVQSPMIRTEQIPLIAIAATWLQLACKVVGYAAVTGYWVQVVTDTKTRVDIENQQFRVLNQQQEKLIADLGRLNKAATSGVLAASIAHELNQPLQSALLNHEMLAQELGAGAPSAAVGVTAEVRMGLDGATDRRDTEAIHELLAEQGESLQRMSAIIQTMRGVFSESGAKRQILDLYRLVKGLGPLISAQAEKNGIEVQYVQFGDGLVRVKASEVQQVILNLLGNAFDALIANHTAQPMVRITVTAHESWVVCTVEDNGPGIPTDLHEEVFKILKTTKNASMGLGLWLARYITQRNQGSIEISDSELGGAKLTVRFPSLKTVGV
jgi:signal transduction histidine kinase